MTPKLIICLQMCPVDEMVALHLVELICAIEKTKRNDVEFCVSPRRDTNPVLVEDMLKMLREKFDVVHRIKCMRESVGWPMGCNDLWAETMMRLSCMHRDGKTQCDGVFTMEADCLPLRPDWIDVLKAEWERCKAAGKEVVGHAHGNPPDHINGNAIFHIKMTKNHPETASASSRKGWDCDHGKLLLSIGLDTPYIFQVYRCPNVDKERLTRMRKHGQTPAIFHGIKGYLGIQLVKAMVDSGEFYEKREGLANFEHLLKCHRDSQVVTDPRICIFIRTYYKDFEWLEWCLKSIAQNVCGYYEVVLAIPFQDEEHWKNWIVNFKDALHLFPEPMRVVFTFEATGDGYLAQQIDKLYADKHTDCDLIAYVDSDCVFPHKTNLRDMLKDGKPYLLARDWANAGEANCWKVPTTNSLGFEATKETMCRHPAVYWRSTLVLLREYMYAVRGHELSDYIASLTNFSEFNCAGNFILKFLADDYHVVTPDKDPLPQISQKWSHGGFTEAARAQCEAELLQENAPGPLELLAMAAVKASELPESHQRAAVTADALSDMSIGAIPPGTKLEGNVVGGPLKMPTAISVKTEDLELKPVPVDGTWSEQNHEKEKAPIQPSQEPAAAISSGEQDAGETEPGALRQLPTENPGDKAVESRTIDSDDIGGQEQ